MRQFLENINILIVDDQLNNLHVLSALLRKEGYGVRKATSGMFALKTIQVEIPDLILLDIRMPQMDGYEVCANLKANIETSSIPIIFLSASDDLHDKVQAFTLGGADYVTKPFQGLEVLARVRHHLIIQQQRKQLRRLEEDLLQAKTMYDQLAAKMFSA